MRQSNTRYVPVQSRSKSLLGCDANLPIFRDNKRLSRTSPNISYLLPSSVLRAHTGGTTRAHHVLGTTRILSLTDVAYNTPLLPASTPTSRRSRNGSSIPFLGAVACALLILSIFLYLLGNLKMPRLSEIFCIVWGHKPL